MKKHIFLLVLTLVVAFSAGQLGYAQTSYATTITLDGQSIIKEKNGTTTTIGAGTVVQVTDLQEHILSGSSQNGNINLNRFLIKNGMVFDIRMPNNYTNIEKGSGKYTIHTDSQGTYLRFTGAGGFSCRYKTVVGGVQESRRIAGDVNYYWIWQLDQQDLADNAILHVTHTGVTGSGANNLNAISDQQSINVSTNKSSAVWWDIAPEGSTNFVYLYEEKSNEKIHKILSDAKEKFPGESNFILRLSFDDNTSNLLSNGTYGGNTFRYLTLKDERTVQYTLTTESHHPTWGTAQPATKTVNAGTEVTLQATPKTGYRFVGWAVGTPSFIVANDNPYQPAINENVRFIAVFEPLPLQITANSNNTAWGSVSPESQTLNAGQTAKVTATSVAPHKFKHWINTATQAVVSTQAEYSFTVNENSSLTAVFEQGVSTYKVTAKSNNTAWGSVSPENQTLNAGQTAKVTATPVAPHKFKHWINTATQAVVSTQAEYSFTVNENSSLTAVFEEGVSTYKVTAKSNNTAWGSVSPENQTLNAGQTAKVTATPVAPHKFKHWINTATQAVVSTQAEYSFTVNENSSLTAVFEQGVSTYKVTAKSNNTAWGSVSPENQTLNAGQTAKVTATPVAPHKFKHWINTATQAVVSTQAEYSFTVNENSSLTAVFEEGVSTYKVTAKSNNTAWGSVSPENQTLNAGQTAKVTATPVAPHKFKHWINTATQAVVSTQAEYSFTVNENSSLTAVFEEGVSTYKVTAKSNNTAWGSVSPENQTLNAGQTAKVTATPVAPHKFKHWINTATQA
ncbi:InlB B-repeat-containing protein, partial [Capnocytophaga canimorsus]|uniref:InlB B-repeat-containing protein n=1 Tax=Capnocytophaga canimorsus TaxID=28188 RepID=UPI0037D1BEC2